jgi:hypothetical protein
LTPGQTLRRDGGARNGGDGDLAALAGGRSSCDINVAGGLVCGDIEFGAIIACGAVQILNKEISAALLHVARYVAGLEFRVNTFRWDLELSALGNLDGLDRLIARALRDVLDRLDDIVALEDLAEDDVATVEPAGDDGGDEELGAWRKSVTVRNLNVPRCDIPLVSLPLLAMLKSPLRVCLSLKFSSGNLAP